jgi:predicted nuclease of predicted toxin-antitoxin system
MKFLVDAQLPYQLSKFLNGLGHDSVHISDLRTGNRTTDDQINALTVAESRALITKDVDFVDSVLTRREPFKLLLVATGNIRNDDLIELVRRNASAVLDQFDAHEFIELTGDRVVIHV